jgi:hypothetical protein
MSSSIVDGSDEIYRRARRIARQQRGIARSQLGGSMVRVGGLLAAFGAFCVGWWLLGFVLAPLARHGASDGTQWAVGIALVVPVLVLVLWIVGRSGRLAARFELQAVIQASEALGVRDDVRIAARIGALSSDASRELHDEVRRGGARRAIQMAVVNAMQVAEVVDDDTPRRIAAPVHVAGEVLARAQGACAALACCGALARAEGRAADDRFPLRAAGTSPATALLRAGGAGRAMSVLAGFLTFCAVFGTGFVGVRAGVIPYEPGIPAGIAVLVLLAGLPWFVFASIGSRVAATECVWAVAVFHASNDGECPAAFADTELADVEAEPQQAPHEARMSAEARATLIDEERRRDLRRSPDELFAQLERYASADEVARVRRLVREGRFRVDHLDDLVHHRRVAWLDEHAA